MTHYEMNTDFPFDEMTLEQPIGLQGGAYLSKLKMKRQCFVQTPSILLKTGITLQGDKRGHIDIMWDTRTNDGKQAHNFMKQFEEHICSHIYSQRERWFDGEFSREDIDYFFQSALKTYQTHYEVMRVVLSRLSKSTLQQLKSSPSFTETNQAQYFGVRIFDERENVLDIADIPPSMIKQPQPAILIIEPYGVKFSSTSFHVVYYLRQIMILENADEQLKPVLQECLIRREPSTKLSQPPADELASANHNPNPNELIQSPPSRSKPNKCDTIATIFEPDKNDVMVDMEELTIDAETQDLSTHTPITLKDPKQVYLDMYFDARKQAMTLWRQAKQAYEEAIHIRRTYQLTKEELSTDGKDNDEQEFRSIFER